MSKFGELIDHKVPVLLNFYTEWSEECETIHPILKDVSAAVGDKAVIIKINVDKNEDLAEALRIKTLPTFLIYKHGEMIWRKSGVMNANDLVFQIKNQI